MLIKIRPHHLVCLTFFRGKGYNLNFVRNVKRILREVEKSTAVVVVVEGCDDVCLECPHRTGVKCMKSKDSDEEVRLMDLIWLKELNLNYGEKLETLKIVKGRITLNKLKNVCGKCEWLSVCLDTAEKLGIKE
ncbi:MAG: DUF1284 domain-containing protein [Candidatus Bathyarchaeota archaeon]